MFARQTCPAAFCTFLLAASICFGQAVSGTISGLVTDPGGSGIPTAALTVRNTGTNFAIKTVANESGNYIVPRLIPGIYNVEVEAAGFKKFLQTGVQVDVDSVVRVDCQLQVGDVVESVTVASDAAVLKVDKADVSAVISEQTLTEIPSFSRNVSLLVSIYPGAVRPGAGFVGETPGGDLSGFVNGVGGSNNYHQLDGVDNQETIQGRSMINPNIDSLQEVKVTLSSYDAEFGQISGALFQASTKSGTNSLHGSLFEYMQNDWFFARNPFTQSTSNVAPFRWNQFGGSLGGPIKKDKLFFFGDWQGMRSRQGNTLVTGIPTTAFKQGDFSSINSLYKIYDPLTGNANGNGRTQFPNNVIPTSRLDPVAKKLVALMPDPNTQDPNVFLQNFTKSGSFASNTDDIDARIDYNHSQHSRLFVRYTYLSSLYYGPPLFGTVLGGPPFAGQAETGGTRTQSLAANYTRIIGTNLVAEARLGFLRFRSNLAQTDVGLKTSDQIGIPGINTGSALTDGLPQFSWDGPILNGAYLGNGFANFYELETGFQYVTNWSYTKGSHLLKWGADIRPHQECQRIDKNFRGGFSFSRLGTSSADVTSLTGLGFASFMLGYASNYSRTVVFNLPKEYQDRDGLYFQDQWRVNKRLTLTLGLRWEYYSPTYADAGLLADFDFNTGQVVVGGIGGNSKYANVQPRHKDFGPRFGLAYTVSPKTVVRMGYGRSHAINASGANFGTYCCIWPLAQTQAFPTATLYGSIPFSLSQGPPTASTALIPIPSSGRLSVPTGISVLGRPFDDPNTALDAWNVTVQHQLTPTTTLEVAYLGNVVRHVWRPHEANAPVPGPGALLPRQPYGALGLNGSINERSSDGTSNFNSFQSRLDKRFSSGYLLLGSFTWQKTITDSYTNPFDRHTYLNLSGPKWWFTLSHVWQLPFGPGRRFGSSLKGAGRMLAEGWEFTGITEFQDGNPFTPSMNANTLNSNFAQLPDRVGSGFVDNPSQTQWFDVTAFRVPAQYKLGNTGQGILTTPGWWLMDLGFDKNFYFTTPLNERTRLVLRAETFNTLNHTNLGTPVTAIDAPASQAGHILGITQNMRRMQIGIHLYF